MIAVGKNCATFDSRIGIKLKLLDSFLPFFAERGVKTGMVDSEKGSIESANTFNCSAALLIPYRGNP